MSAKEQALKAADNVITSLLQAVSEDYSPYRQEIADLFSGYLWNGTWDMTLDEVGDLPALRFIQEDEYDQHMDEGDEDGNPRPEDPLTLVEGHYIFEA